MARAIRSPRVSEGHSCPCDRPGVSPAPHVLALVVRPSGVRPLIGAELYSAILLIHVNFKDFRERY